MTAAGIGRVRAFETAARALPQVDVPIDHVLHAGMYSRTAFIPAGVTITGALVKVPTLLVVTGEVLVYIGEDAPLRLSGHNVVPAAAGRKQAFHAISAVALTMVFPTPARTVEEAEAEFTDEAHLLQSRRAACPA